MSSYVEGSGDLLDTVQQRDRPESDRPTLLVRVKQVVDGSADEKLERSLSDSLYDTRSEQHPVVFG